MICRFQTFTMDVSEGPSWPIIAVNSTQLADKNAPVHCVLGVCRQPPNTPYASRSPWSSLTVIIYGYVPTHVKMVHECRHTLDVNRSLRCLWFCQRALAEYSKVSENAIVFRCRGWESAAAASGSTSTSRGALGERFKSCPIFNGRSEFIETKHVRQT